MARHLCSSCYHRWYRSLPGKAPKRSSRATGRPRGSPPTSRRRYVELNDLGLSDFEIASRLGIKEKSLRDMKRAWRRKGLIE